MRKIKKPFARKYADLSSFEQLLLQLCSVMYETKNRTTLLKCYKKAGLPLPKGPFTQAKHITPFMKRLQECDFLDEKFNCRPEIAESATRCAIHDGYYDMMVKVVLQEMRSPPSLAEFFKIHPQSGSTWILLLACDAIDFGRQA